MTVKIISADTAQDAELKVQQEIDSAMMNRNEVLKEIQFSATASNVTVLMLFANRVDFLDEQFLRAPAED